MTVNCLPLGRFSVARGLDPKHTYIGKATLNGKPLERAFLRHEEIIAGGELQFEMQAEPNKAWASGADVELPYSMSSAR